MLWGVAGVKRQMLLGVNSRMLQSAKRQVFRDAERRGVVGY